MNTDIIKGNWEQIKGKIIQQWAKFTDDDVTAMKGTHEELNGKLQAKYGYAKEKASEEIDAFLKKNDYKKDE